MSRDTSVVENKYLIVQLQTGLVAGSATHLGEAARMSGLSLLGTKLREYRVEGERVIRSLSPLQLAGLERGALGGGEPRSLADYWRLDVTGAPAPLGEIAAALEGIPGVALVYEEPGVRDAAQPADDPLSGSQHYLDAAPFGVGARWLWDQPCGDGAGMQFVDLEQGWLRGHEDLPAYQVIYGENGDGNVINGGPYIGDHGAAVLGIVAGLDNDLGIIGMAPQVATRTVSHWTVAGGNMHVADALAYAAMSTPRPNVILLEVQTDDGHPVETDAVVRDVIRCATVRGIVVVEAGGNGQLDLDAWGDGKKKYRLNRASKDFIDSGAIVVGAARAALPHDKWPFSNWGSRMDCYAWGEGIVTAGGYGTDHRGTGYTGVFSGTSGASAIIAGCALLLQGRAWNLGGTPLPPLVMRSLLSNPLTGTPQGADVTKHIGVMPNLQAIVQSVAVTSPISAMRERRLLAAVG